MGVKSHANMAKVADVMSKAAVIMKEEIMVQLKYLGEESVKRIREAHPNDWMDQTSNLRSSTGYAIFDYGRDVMKSAFESVGGPKGSGSEGSKKGEEFINSLATQYARTFALVVVAGMEYAEHVEARGRDVISGAELWAKQEVDQRVKDGIEVAEARINNLIKQSV